MRMSIVLSVLMVALAIVSADADERVAPVTDPVVKKECGSCHMVFPPQFLPQRSWQKLVETLSDHFGENASLGEAEQKAVLDYLLAMPRTARTPAARAGSSEPASRRRTRRSASRRRRAG